MKNTRKTALAVALMVPMIGAAAIAQDRGHEGHFGHGGDIHHFADRDMGLWRGGHWFHGPYGGRVGWWWIVGDSWFFYPAPLYPYPDPYVPPVVTAPAAPQSAGILSVRARMRAPVATCGGRRNGAGSGAAPGDALGATLPATPWRTSIRT
jgi:hypothetical protein